MAGWRITDLMRRNRENKPLPNRHGGGWKREDVDKLLNHTIRGEAIGSFDLAVIRIPHGWISLDNITEPKLSESVSLVQELFGVRNVIFLSLPFVSKAMTVKDLRALHKTNEMLKAFARKKHFAVDNILVLDFGRLGDTLTAWNGRLLGYNVTNNADYLSEGLRCSEYPKPSQSIAQVCGERVDKCSRACTRRNGFSIDGLHWCGESLNGRLNAGTACLVQCPYSDVDVRECEKDCNDRFMSLRPIEVFADSPLTETS